MLRFEKVRLRLSGGMRGPRVHGEAPRPVIQPVHKLSQHYVWIRVSQALPFSVPPPHAPVTCLCNFGFISSVVVVLTAFLSSGPSPGQHSCWTPAE